MAVNFGGTAQNDKQYFNKGAEMWALMLDWIKAGGCIPDDTELRDDLCNREYGYDNKQRLQIESKKDMKSRGLASPDKADSPALTFAMPVQKKRHVERGRMQHVGATSDNYEHNPFDFI
jgi:hypothetical protein